MSKISKWLEDDKHLPEFLRDFHDQKDVFKLIDKTWPQKDPNHCVDWVRAHVYVIDRFLRFMALCGYTLQRTRVQAEFSDLGAAITEMKKKEAAVLAQLLKGAQP